MRIGFVARHHHQPHIMKMHGTLRVFGLVVLLLDVSRFHGPWEIAGLCDAS